MNNFKDNIRKARDIVLDNCLDLGQLPNPKIGHDFFVKEGVKLVWHTDLSATPRNGSNSANGKDLVNEDDGD